ncbi:MAG: metalloregulator ArsR/SmtB family transcription factor [Eubacteriales bacterium]|nr:metalloregulator ArsR/SmtB family transcription factor [Eubacteriales bacterium]
MQLSFTDTALIFKALSDETRLKIVDMLSAHELCACNILEAFHITQPTLSYHMRILCECGLVIPRKEGSWTKYSLNIALFSAMLNVLNSVKANFRDSDVEGMNRVHQDLTCTSTKTSGGVS